MNTITTTAIIQNKTDNTFLTRTKAKIKTTSPIIRYKFLLLIAL